MAVINYLKSGGTKLPESIFYGFWQLRNDNGTYILKVYDTGKLDYEIYTSSATKYVDLDYTIANGNLTFQIVGGSKDNIEITIKTFKYENDNLIDTSTNDIYTKILFADGTLSVTENGIYGPSESNGFKEVEVNVVGGDYDIEVTENDDGTQSLYITDSDSSIDRNAIIKGLIERDVTTFEIPEGTTKIGDYAFYSFVGMKSLKIPESVINIGNYAFYDCSGLTSVTLGSGVTSIGNYAFGRCRGLTSITIPESVTSIGGYAFSGCSGLTSITLPSSVTSIGNSAFQYCSNVTSITIPESVTSIGGYVFQYCSSLTSITIPSSVTSIGNGAFNSCTSLTEMTILATTPPTLSSTSAISRATTTIYIPAGTLSTYQSATNWSSFASKFVELEV